MKSILISLIILHIILFSAVAESNVPRNKCDSPSPEIGFRIVKGNEARRHAYPWLAQVWINTHFNCGAVLITQRHVLTAAHCVSIVNWPDPNDPHLTNISSTLKVILGAHRRKQREPQTEVIRNVTRITLPQYYRWHKRDPSENDIAILTLNAPVDLTPFIKPAILATPRSSLLAGEKAIIAGWGRNTSCGRLKERLQETRVKILSHDECVRTNVSTKLIEDQMVCAYSWQPIQDLRFSDACQGDRGGPLMVERMYELEVAGIISWGRGCGRNNRPGVYTRVAHYYEWISTVVGW